MIRQVLVSGVLRSLARSRQVLPQFRGASQSGQGILTRTDLVELLTEPPQNFVLIDVRDPDELIDFSKKTKSEDTGGMIPHAKNVPLGDLESAIKMSSQDFESKYKFSKPKKTDKVVMYCRSGVRAQNACELIAQHGYENVLNYKGSALEFFHAEGRDDV